jgi:hypothetical protein
MGIASFHPSYALLVQAGNVVPVDVGEVGFSHGNCPWLLQGPDAKVVSPFEPGGARRNFTLRMEAANTIVIPFPSQIDGAARITPSIVHSTQDGLSPRNPSSPSDAIDGYRFAPPVLAATAQNREQV